MPLLYRIPSQYLSGFKLIASLSTNQVREFCEKADSFPVSANSSTSLHDINLEFGWTQNQLLQALSAYTSILSLSLSTEENSENLAESISNSFAVQVEDATPQQRESLRSNLLLLLTNTSNARMSMKANNLAQEYDKVVDSFRIITDLRPVFKDNISEDSQYGIVIHQLKIDYQQDGLSKSVYLALSGEKLVSLKKQIERALQKEGLIFAESFCKGLQLIDKSKNE